MNPEQKKEILNNANSKCRKCGYYSPLGEGIEINKNFNVVLCNICNTFAPETLEKFNQYVDEKVEWQNLDTFRNSGVNRSSHSVHKNGMIAKSKEGMLMARPAFGYDVKNGQLVVNQETSETVREIFKSFLAGTSLNQIAKRYGISVNGIKKILKNFTYIGKMKFASQISQGNHKAIISPELFNQVQQRFEELAKKRTIEPDSQVESTN
jgi:DNA-binding CsgD family transcriptional regulator